jgi:hypothetical protein
VFHLVLLDIPLIPVKFDFPCHETSIAPPICSVKHYRLEARASGPSLRLWFGQSQQAGCKPSLITSFPWVARQQMNVRAQD